MRRPAGWSVSTPRPACPANPAEGRDDRGDRQGTRSASSTADGTTALEAERPERALCGGRRLAVFSSKATLERRSRSRWCAASWRAAALRWQRTQDEFPWLAKVRRCVYHQGLVVCEISTLNDDKPGNAIHVLSAADGKPLWSRSFVPRSSHLKQARAMFTGDLLWVLDEDKKCVGLDPRSGAVQEAWPAGMTPLLSAGGHGAVHASPARWTSPTWRPASVDANRITKAACSRDAGVVPANGLIYTLPKHCICWPMLRDYAALAPARPGQDAAAGRTSGSCPSGRRRAARRTAAGRPQPTGPATATTPCAAGARRPAAART